MKSRAHADRFVARVVGPLPGRPAALRSCLLDRRVHGLRDSPIRFSAGVLVDQRSAGAVVARSNNRSLGMNAALSTGGYLHSKVTGPPKVIGDVDHNDPRGRPAQSRPPPFADPRLACRH